MKIHTFTVVVGSQACNLRCPYCVSKMTPTAGLKEVSRPNFRNFGIAAQFAAISGVSTVLFTGKGEPVLYPDLLSGYLSYLQSHDLQYSFPFKELQTNGIGFDPKCGSLASGLANEWYKMGLTLVCISVGHYDPARNNELLRPIYKSSGLQYNFWRSVDALHEIGYSVRINCTLFKGGVDSPEELAKLMESCKSHGVEQITVRMVSKPDSTENLEVAQWVETHQYDDSWVEKFIVSNGGVHLLDLPHGARIYDWQGQNICISTCLTETTNRDDIRQMIFFPDGSLRYSWAYEGARIL